MVALSARWRHIYCNCLLDGTTCMLTFPACEFKFTCKNASYNPLALPNLVGYLGVMVGVRVLVRVMVS